MSDNKQSTLYSLTNLKASRNSLWSSSNTFTRYLFTTLTPRDSVNFCRKDEHADNEYVFNNFCPHLLPPFHLLHLHSQVAKIILKFLAMFFQPPCLVQRSLLVIWLLIISGTVAKSLRWCHLTATSWSAVDVLLSLQNYQVYNTSFRTHFDLNSSLVFRTSPLSSYWCEGFTTEFIASWSPVILTSLSNKFEVTCKLPSMSTVVRNVNLYKDI